MADDLPMEEMDDMPELIETLPAALPSLIEQNTPAKDDEFKSVGFSLNSQSS